MRDETPAPARSTGQRSCECHASAFRGDARRQPPGCRAGGAQERGAARGTGLHACGFRGKIKKCAAAATQAHFANIDQRTPLASQERAPTSVAYAENQSMFLDSLAGDAAWLARYAVSRAGERVPWALVERSLRATHPYAVFAVRGMLSVPFFEKALYELPEARVTPEEVLALADATEARPNPYSTPACPLPCPPAGRGLAARTGLRCSGARRPAAPFALWKELCKLAAEPVRRRGRARRQQVHACTRSRR